jgi:hypothetical protein
MRKLTMLRKFRRMTTQATSRHLRSQIIKHSLDKHYDTGVKDYWDKTIRVLMMAHYTQDC